MHVLIVEDNRELADNIADYLESKGQTFDFAKDGITAVQRVASEEYDIILLDVMLPGMDGFTVCRTIRAEKNRRVPILMLTSRDTLPDKLTGFESGADDYLVKPFELEELWARLQALYARSAASQNEVLKIHDLELNPETHMVQRAHQDITLTKTCFKLLQILMAASPRIVPRAELELKLWDDMPPGSDVLRTNMYTLRNKIDKPFSKPLLQTVHGVGYRILNPDNPDE